VAEIKDASAEVAPQEEDELARTREAKDAAEAKVAGLEAKVAELEAEVESLKAKLTEAQRKPAAMSAHAQIVSDGERESTGSKGMDAIARLMAAK
jgi:phage shock protein A